MAENFNANAELSFDVSDFLSSGKKAEEILDHLDVAVDVLGENIDKLGAAFAESGKQAREAARQTKSADDEVAANARDAIRLRKMYEDDFRREQRDAIRLGTMYEKEADAQVLASARARLSWEQAQEQQRVKWHSQGIKQRLQAEQRLASETIAAQKAVERQANQEQANLSRARYALYDVSTVFTAVSAAALGTVGAVSAVGVSFERDFANVARTSGLTVQSDIDALRTSLTELSKDIPVDFASIATIGTLAGQLGVAAEDIANFTEVVAMFSASTNVSVEKSAEDIGRVAQLTQTAGEEYENLASSIYQVGVTSVATEGEILETATNIATAGNLAGLTAAQIVALSASFASLGVAPERARGTVQRVFGELTAAASEGGEALAAYANISGMAADEFAAAWSNEPQVAFNAFVQGLGSAQAAGQDTNAMLKDLGISAVRDIQALQVLANNFEVYADAQNEANNGFVGGTALAEGYAITAETTAAKIQVLVNNTKELLDTMSNTPAVQLLVAALQDVVEVTDALLSNPVGKFFVTSLGGVVALVGVYALYNAAVARATASAYANRTALETMRKEGGNVQIGIRGMASEMLKMTQILRTVDGGAKQAATSLSAVGTAAQTAATQTAAANTTLTATAGSGGRAATALGAVGTAAKGVGAAIGGLVRFVAPVAGLWAAFEAGSWIVETVQRATESASGRAKRVYGDLENLSSAIAKDTQEWEKQTAAGGSAAAKAAKEYSVMTVSVRDTARATDENAAALRTMLGASGEQVDQTGTLTEKVREQTVALGANAQAWLFNQYSTGDNFDELLKYFNTFKEYEGQIAGFSIEDLFSSAMDPNSGGASAYVQKLIDDDRVAVDAALAERQRLIDEAARMGTVANVPIVSDEDLKREQDLAVALQGVLEIAKDMDAGLRTGSEGVELFGIIAKATGQDLGELEAGAADAGDEVETLADKMKAFGAGVNAAADVEQAMYDLGAAIADNGSSFDIFSEGGRDNLDAVGKAISALVDQAGEDTGLLAGNLVAMVHNLENAGVDTQNELGYVFDMLNELTGNNPELDFSTAEARSSIRAFLVDAIKAAEARAELERKTVSASSLGGFDPKLAAQGKNPYGNLKSVEDTAAPYKAQAAALRDMLDALDAQSTKTSQGSSVQRGYSEALQKSAASNDKASASAKKNKKAVEDQTKAVRTYRDYANDLATVLDRSFELRFGNEIAADKVIDAQEAVKQVYQDQNDLIADQREKIQSAKQSIDEYDASITTLRSDILSLQAGNKVLEHQLMLARMYGDTFAESRISAKIAANNAKIGESTTEIAGIESDRAKAQTDLVTSSAALEEALRDLSAGLEGNSQFARDLREAYRGLIQSQNDEIIQMAANGVSNDALKGKVGEHKEQVKGLGTQYGESAKSIAPFITAVNDSKAALATVPKDVTVTLKYHKDGTVDTVGTAYAELKSKTVTAEVKANQKSIDDTRKALNSLPKSLSVPLGVSLDQAASAKAARIMKLLAQIEAEKATMTKNIKAGADNKADRNLANIKAWEKMVANGGYRDGGFTGRGGKDEVAGVVHKGEVVIPQQYVNQSTGLPDMSALGFLAKGVSMPPKNSGSSSTSGGIQLVEILPTQVRAITDAMNVLVNLDLESLTRGVNYVNEQSNSRGMA